MEGSGVALRIRGKSGKLGLREPEVQADAQAVCLLGLCVSLSVRFQGKRRRLSGPPLLHNHPSAKGRGRDP